MSFFKGSTGDSVRENGGEKSRKAVWSIRNYHKYFEGYVERETTNANGKIKPERVYIADYYCPPVSAAVWGLYKCAYFLLTLVLWLLFFNAAGQRLKVNTYWFVTFPQAIFIAAAAWMSLALVMYLVNGKKMTIYEYHTTSVRLRRAAMAVTAAAFVLAIVTACCALMMGANDTKQILLCSGIYLLSGGSSFVIFTLESHMKYERIPSGNKKHEDDVVL